MTMEDVEQERKGVGGMPAVGPALDFERLWIVISSKPAGGGGFDGSWAKMVTDVGRLATRERWGGGLNTFRRIFMVVPSA